MIKVVHSSKYIDYIFNFTATENNLSWSLTAEGDGDLFLNPLTNGLSTNVASFTIDGSAPTFPISLINGSSKSVAIVKTTNGQTASLTLRQRRSVNKAVNYNVPDFGAYNGRYTYALHSNTTINIFDMSLFTSENYLGAGTFTTMPLIITKILPTLPILAKWYLAEFVVISNVEYFFMLGSKDDSSDVYSCKIRVSDGQITNESDIIDSYTKISLTSALRYGVIQNCTYDYISNIIYVSMAIGYNGYNSFSYNLSSKVFSPYVGGASFITQFNYRNGIKFYFDPILKRIITSNAEFSFDPFKACPYIYNPGYTVNFNIYRALNGYRYRDLFQGETYNTFQIYSSGGDYLAQVGSSSYIGRIMSAQLLEPYIFQYELNNGKVVAIFNLNTNTGNSYTFSADFPTNSVSFIDACVSQYNGERHFLVATKENASGTFSRLFRIYESGGVFSYIYFDLAGVCQDIGNNRLLV